VPRVLWVTAEVPDAALGGGSIRQAHLLRTVAASAETHLLLAGRLGPGGPPAELAGVVELTVSPAPLPDSHALRRLVIARRALFSRHPETVHEHRGALDALRPALRRSADFDVVLVEHAGLAPLVTERVGSRWVLTMHNLPSVQAEQAAGLAPSSRHRWLWEREAAKARRLEADAGRAFDTVIAVSDQDASRLTGDVRVVPNGVDLEAFMPTPLPSTPSLVFTGTLDYRPNVDGILWFCREVLPSAARRVPGLTLTIAGRRPVPAVRELARQPGVSVIADVADIRPVLQRARLAVVPIRLGTGTRLKVLEAMAAGRPVVGTAVGLEGLGVEAGRHALVADDPAGLADAIVSLCADTELAARLAAGGRQLVEARYGWDDIGRRLTAVLLGA
jgi:glycosyltransferase involved in cell wall biosynthesis